MKAKEYAERYKAEGSTDEALSKVWLDMFCEVKTIAEQRHAKSDEAAIAIVREINDKWKAFARLAGPEIRPEGFMELIAHRCPDLYALIMIGGGIG